MTPYHKLQCLGIKYWKSVHPRRVKHGTSIGPRFFERQCYLEIHHPFAEADRHTKLRMGIPMCQFQRSSRLIASTARNGYMPLANGLSPISPSSANKMVHSLCSDTQKPQVLRSYTSRDSSPDSFDAYNFSSFEYQWTVSSSLSLSRFHSLCSVVIGDGPRRYYIF